MISTLETIFGAADPKGEINIRWQYPVDVITPGFATPWKFHLFKKSKQAPSDKTIARYMSAGYGLAGMTDEELVKDGGTFVYRDFPQKQNTLNDFHVLNGVEYFYRGVIAYDTPIIENILVQDDPNNSVDRFYTNLRSLVPDLWKNYLLQFTSGELDGQYVWISGYDGPTHFLQVAKPLNSVPVDGDTFSLIAVSTPVDFNIMAALNIRVNTIDGKGLVIRAMEKTIDAMRSGKTGSSPVIGNNIKVYRDFASAKDEDFWVCVTRTPGQSVERYLDSIITQVGSQVVVGDVDIDSSNVEWITTSNPLLRDKFTDLMRAFRPLFRHYVLKMGAGKIRDVKIIMSGDAEGSLISGANAIKGGMTVILIIENQLEYGTLASNAVEINTSFSGEE